MSEKVIPLLQAIFSGLVILVKAFATLLRFIWTQAVFIWKRILILNERHLQLVEERDKSKQTNHSPSTRSSPAPDPIMTITDTPWGVELQQFRSQNPALASAIMQKVMAWSLLTSMGNINAVPVGAQQWMVDAALETSFLGKNFHYTGLQISLFKVCKSVQGLEIFECGG